MKVRERCRGKGMGEISRALPRDRVESQGPEKKNSPALPREGNDNERKQNLRALREGNRQGKNSRGLPREKERPLPRKGNRETKDKKPGMLPREGNGVRQKCERYRGRWDVAKGLIRFFER